MDDSKRRRRRSKGAQLSVDDLGGRSDGGLAITTPEGEPLYSVSPRIAGAMRFLVARVRSTQASGVPERLAVTSAQRGEGVTYITRALAAVIAYDSPSSVAIVDCNWTTPKPDSDGHLGLADLAEGRASVDDIVIRTANSHLAVIPPGAVPIARRAGLGGSDAFEDALQALEAQFDHLLMDLPPVLASSEAISLAESASSYLLVVRQGSTPGARVEDAIEEMRGHEPLGVVLNRYATRIPKVMRRLIET